jgi:hypothetical protein
MLQRTWGLLVRPVHGRMLWGQTVGRHGFVHELPAVVGVEHPQRKGHGCPQLLQRRRDERPIAHDERDAFRPAGRPVGQRQRVYDAPVGCTKADTSARLSGDRGSRGPVASTGSLGVLRSRAAVPGFDDRYEPQ